MALQVPRLVVLGDGGVGKTCIITRYVRDMFYEDYAPTLEAHYKADIKLVNGETQPVEITDTAGQEDFKALRDICIGEGDIFLVVYSVTEFKSLRFADELIEYMERTKEGPIFIVLAGNKCDLEKERQVARADAQAVADKHKAKFIETSAMTKQGINEVFLEIARMWSERPKPPERVRKVKKKKKVQQDPGCCSVQ
jgi:small GTP-binding protein